MIVRLICLERKVLPLNIWVKFCGIVTWMLLGKMSSSWRILLPLAAFRWCSCCTWNCMVLYCSCCTWNVIRKMSPSTKRFLWPTSLISLKLGQLWLLPLALDIYISAEQCLRRRGNWPSIIVIEHLYCNFKGWYWQFFALYIMRTFIFVSVIWLKGALTDFLHPSFWTPGWLFLPTLSQTEWPREIIIYQDISWYCGLKLNH